MKSMVLFVDRTNDCKVGMIYFRSEEEQKEYKEKEKDFCVNEMGEYYKAYTPTQRTEALDKLYEKRKVFAESQGYFPVENNRYKYVRVGRNVQTGE